MNTLRFVLSALLAAFIVAGCGGGTGGTGVTNGGPTNAVSIGVMAKGSVIVNGVHFDDSTANIQVENHAGNSNDLQNGKLVKVRGQINDDRVTGVARQVKVEPEVRGTVQTTNPSAVPPSFTVGGQIILVDDLTGFANLPASPSAAVGALVGGTSVVEVHGLRDANGSIHASRVELLSANPFGDELRGTVVSPTATTFTLRNGAVDVSVSYTAGAVFPTGATLSAGQAVEVHGSFTGTTTFTATRVDIEDLEDVQFEHAAGEEFEIEGQVSGCGSANPCTSFSVGNQAVQTNASTRFENGSTADLGDGVRVEAEGHTFSGSTLVAEKITFKRTRVILTGAATVTGLIPGSGTLQIFGKSIQITSFTEIDQTGGITSGEQVEVRGFIDSNGNIVAERIDDNPSGGNKDIVQARVTAESGNVLTLLVGINADLTGATQFSDTNELPITLTAFLTAVTPAAAPAGGTLVKVKGTFNSGNNTIAVEEAELEN